MRDRLHFESEEKTEGVQERFTLGVTATLTLAVLSLVVTEKVPHMSDEIPVLGGLRT